MTLTELPLYVDKAEAARALRCSAAVLERLVDSGRLRPVCLDPEDDGVRFRPEDLLQIVDETARAPQVERRYRPVVPMSALHAPIHDDD